MSGETSSSKQVQLFTNSPSKIQTQTYFSISILTVAQVLPKAEILRRGVVDQAKEEVLIQVLLDISPMTPLYVCGTSLDK